jgi:phosphoserine aminotransferase
LSRTYNFSAGPASLPDAVLKQAAEEMTDYQSSGMSVMEMSHRSKIFVDIAAQAEADLRELMGVSDDYHVLFLQGGATGQFAGIPMNLTQADDTIDFIETGAWSKKAIKEAKKYCNVNVAASSADSNFDHIPDQGVWQLRDNARLLHICSNETIGGVQFKNFPSSNVPIAVDMSSDILSRPVDVNNFAVIYAGAQKNIGPAGLTVVIVRKDLCGNARDMTPTFLDYAQQADNDSMINTPPTYGWYLAGLVFKWIKAQGGVAAIDEHNQVKANLLYSAIENSNFYSSPVASANRSTMNVPFTLADSALDGEFVKQAEARGMFNLKGHRSVGGMRASIYNAVSLEAVQALVSFMSEFENERG